MTEWVGESRSHNLGNLIRTDNRPFRMDTTQDQDPSNPLISQEEIRFLLLVVPILSIIFIWSGNVSVPHRVLGSLGSLIVLCLPFISILRYPKGSLQMKISDERRRLCPNESRLLFKFKIRDIYNPTPISILIILSIGVALNAVTFLPVSERFLPAILDASRGQHFNNLIAIHAGIGAIIFALLIFVAESLREESKERARVLLRESLLFPLTVLEIITFVGFLFFNWQSPLSLVPVLAVAALAIYALYKLISTLLSLREFEKKRTKLLCDRIRESIDEAINERIGNSILHKFLEGKETGLGYSYMTKKDQKEHVVFKLNKVGSITDIDFGILAEIGEIVESAANKKGFSLFENKPKIDIQGQATTIDTLTTAPIGFYTPLKRWDAAVTKRYKETLDAEAGENVVFSLNKAVFGDNLDLHKEIDRLISRAFKVGKINSYSEDLKPELENLRDQFIQAIREKRLTQIDRFRNIYLAITDTFLDLINECGGGFTPEQAKQEASPLSGWTEIQWLDEHLSDALKESFATGDEDLIRKVSSIPLSLAIRGIAKGDHYVFQLFIRYARGLHYRVLNTSDKALKGQLLNKGSEWLREITDYYIEYELDDSPEKISFAVQVLIEIQNILKQSYDANNYGSFDETANVLEKLLKRFKPSDNFPNAEHWKMELERAPEENKEQIRERLKSQEELENAERNFNDRRDQLLYGLCAWIFKDLRRDPAAKADKRRFFDRLVKAQPPKLEDITALFSQVKSREADDFWGWHWWDVIPNGGVQTMDFDSDLEFFYILLALNSLVGKTEEEVASINLPPSRELAYMAESNSIFDQKLRGIPTNENFKLFLREGAIDAIPILKMLLERSKTKQEEIEADFIRNSTLSPKKVEEFWNLFQQEFYSNASLRSLFKSTGKYSDKSKGRGLDPKNVSLMGYNQLDAKEGFLESWHVHYVGWGEQYGEGFARSEDVSIYKSIVQNLEKTKEINFEDIGISVESAIKSGTYSKPVLLSPFAYRMEMDGIRSSEKFVQKWHNNAKQTGYEDYPFYIGYFDFGKTLVPVFRVVGPEQITEKNACLVDLARIGVLKQYPPIRTMDDKQFQRDIFLFKVIDLNANTEEFEKLIVANPDWLQQQADPAAYLRRKVLLNIYSKYEFVFEDKSAGVLFTFLDRELEE